MLKFFRIPFATSGDKTAIPDAVDPSGNVSYTQGYSFDYQRQKTDPAAKNIERDKMNEVLFDITTAIAEIQAQGIPDFITAALNGGVAYSYGQYAIVKYAGEIYISRVETNVDLPTDPASWAPFSSILQGIGVTAPQFDNDTSLATTAFAQAIGLKAGDILVATSTQTLVASIAGKSVLAGVASTPITLTLPLVSTVPIGSRIPFVNTAGTGAGIVTIARQGTDVIWSSASQTSIPLGIGARLTLEASVAGQWTVVEGSGLGIGQTRGNVARTSGVTFFNPSLTKPMEVRGYFASSAAGQMNFNLVTGGITYSGTPYAGGANYGYEVRAIVQPGESVVLNAVTNCVLVSSTELYS